MASTSSRHVASRAVGKWAGRARNTRRQWTYSVHAVGLRSCQIRSKRICVTERPRTGVSAGVRSPEEVGLRVFEGRCGHGNSSSSIEKVTGVVG